MQQLRGDTPTPGWRGDRVGEGVEGAPTLAGRQVIKRLVSAAR